MSNWTGFFSKSGSPALKIKVSGPFKEGKEYGEAVLDTGFTGFLSIPMMEAVALGLVLHGTTAVSLADGTTSFRFTAQGMVKVEEETQIGVAILEPSSSEILLGMAFLRQFNRILYLDQNAVLLVTPEELEKQASKSQSASQSGHSPAATHN